MRIKELQIDGFAALHGENIPVDVPLTVVVGPNEAGKSSLHRFIRSMLYGFANRGQPVERGEPVNGGRHGGRLVLTDGREDYVLERHGDTPSRRGGPSVLLRDSEGGERPLSQAELERLWLGGVSEKLFRQLFAVTLDELHELRTLQGDEVGNYLYHAGIAGGASLSSAIKTISGEMEKLYKPKGELPELNRILAELKEAETALRQSRKGTGPYNEAIMELKAVELELLHAEELLPERQRQAATAQGAAEAREEWLRVESLRLEEEELAKQLPNPLTDPLPEHAEVKWEALVAARSADRERLGAAKAEWDGMIASRQGLSWQEELVRRLPELEALEARRESVAARREERAELSADIRLLDENLASMLGRLSANWREAELQAFAQVPERERSRQLLAALQEAERKLDKSQEELRGLERRQSLEEEEERELDKNAAQGGQATTSTGEEWLPGTKEALHSAWNELEDARRDWDRASREEKLWAQSLPGFGTEAVASAEEPVYRAGGRMRRTDRRSRDSQGGRPSPVWLGASTGMLAIAAIALPIASGMPASEALGFYLLGAAFAAFALFSLRPRGSAARDLFPAGQSENARKHAEAQSRARESEHRWLTAMRQLVRHPEGRERALYEDAQWQSLRAAVQEQATRLEQAERERDAARERERKRAAQDRERDRLEQERSAAQAGSNAARTDWESWLEERKLSKGLPPELLPELFQLAEQALQAYRQRARMQERSEQLAGGEAAFEAAAAELFAECPAPPAAGGDTLLAVKLLHAEALRQREIAAEASRLDERLRQARSAHDSAREAASASEAALQAALDAAGETDEAAYVRRLRVDERRRAIRRESREAELRLAAGRDATGLAELQERLARQDEAALQLSLAQARQALREQERLRSELLERRGRLAQQLERLRAEAETDDRVIAIEELNAEVGRLAERYAVLALCAELIRRTKAVFEEGKQPLVLHKASRYFSILTAGAYGRIIAPGDSPALLAETRDRRVIDSSFLSRGTREQLYLALRFALAGATSPEQELPLVLDDLFVHFDDVRLLQASEVLAEVSAERQILLFTCHEHVAEIMARGVPNAALVRLKAGSAALAEAGYPSP